MHQMPPEMLALVPRGVRGLLDYYAMRNAALKPYLLDYEDDTRFAFGLGVILDGLERRRGP